MNTRHVIGECCPEHEPLLVPVFTGWRRVEYLLGAALWAAALVYFWRWWLEPANHVDLAASILVTRYPGLGDVACRPISLSCFSVRAVQTARCRLPAGSRVAMVVTKAPSEPFAVVAETLRAMLTQDVAHDTWLADEDPSAGNARLVRGAWRLRLHAQGTRGLSPQDVAATHALQGRQSRLLLRSLRLRRATILSCNSMRTMCRMQTICSRCCVPSPTRLWAMSPHPASATAMLPKAGLRADGSMPRRACTARCRPATTAASAPLCIGSHYAVRTAALQANRRPRPGTGGRSFDHADDECRWLARRACAGRHRPWRRPANLRRSCHAGVPVVAQSGDDPAAVFAQAMCGICRCRLKFQFLFSQLWYPFFSLFMALMFVLPIVALVLRRELRCRDLSRFPGAFPAAGDHVDRVGLSLARHRHIPAA